MTTSKKNMTTGQLIDKLVEHYGSTRAVMLLVLNCGEMEKANAQC